MKNFLVTFILMSSAFHIEGSFAKDHAQESLNIFGLCTAATTLYGTLNGIGIGGLFPEFAETFTIYRGFKEVLGGDGKRAGAAWGAFSSWWVGPLLSLVVIPAARYGKNPLKASELVKPGLMTLAGGGAISWLNGAATYLHLKGGGYGSRADIGGSINSTAYSMGGVGGLACSVYLWLSRYQ